MAEALRKIGFRRIFPLYKREPEFRSYRVLEWLQLDPHPPIYFRVERLENLKEPEKIKIYSSAFNQRQLEVISELVKGICYLTRGFLNAFLKYKYQSLFCSPANFSLGFSTKRQFLHMIERLVFINLLSNSLFRFFSFGRLTIGFKTRLDQK